MLCRGTCEVEQEITFLFPLPLFLLSVKTIISPQHIYGVNEHERLQFINYFKTMLITRLLKVVSYFCGLFLPAVKDRKTICRA
jgi:hypothetical protein